LETFLLDVAAGGTVTALEEAQIAARADPRKEKKRLERQEERTKLQGLKDIEAYRRLSKEGYQLRYDATRKRCDARLKKAAEAKVAAVALVGLIHKLMWTHPDGHTLMVGMPSKDLLGQLTALPGCDAKMEGFMSAEVRRFQRAVGMSMWEVVMAHNRCVDPRGATGGYVVDGGAHPDDGRCPEEIAMAPVGGMRGRLLRQATLTSWKLLPEDAAALIDALEYEQDIAAAEAAALDELLLRTHPLVVERVVASVGPAVPVGLRKAGSALLRRTLDVAGMKRQSVVAPLVGADGGVKGSAGLGVDGRTRKLVPDHPYAKEKAKKQATGESGWVAGVGKVAVLLPTAEPFGTASKYDVLSLEEEEVSIVSGEVAVVTTVVVSPPVRAVETGGRLRERAAKVAAVTRLSRPRKVREVGSPLQKPRNEECWVWRSPDPVSPWEWAPGRFQFHRPAPSPPAAVVVTKKFRRLPTVGCIARETDRDVDLRGTAAEVALVAVIPAPVVGTSTPVVTEVGLPLDVAALVDSGRQVVVGCESIGESIGWLLFDGPGTSPTKFSSKRDVSGTLAVSKGQRRKVQRTEGGPPEVVPLVAKVATQDAHPLVARCLVASVAATSRSRAEVSAGVTLGKQARVDELSVVKTRAQKVSRRSLTPSLVETAGVERIEVVTDMVVVPSEVSGSDAAVDLTVNETVAFRHRGGRWSAVATAGGRAVLSRVVSEEELFRNTGHQPESGLCSERARLPTPLSTAPRDHPR